MSKMIAVTMGDPAGIGPEIIIKSLAEGALSGAPVVVVGCAQTLRRILALNITPRAELRIIDHPAEASFSQRPSTSLMNHSATRRGCALAKSRPRQGISRFAASGGRPRWRWRARSRPSLPRR